MESEGLGGIIIIVIIGVVIAALVQSRSKGSDKKRVQPDRPTPGGNPGTILNKKTK